MKEKPAAPAEKPTILSPLTITLIYAVVGGIYILFSDRLLGYLVAEHETIMALQTAKGWAYVVVTAVMLYLLIRSLTGQLQRLLMQVRKNEERVRGTLDNMLEACVIVDFNWRYVYVNKAAARQTRGHAKDLLGLTMLEVFPGIDSTKGYALAQDCMNKRVHQQIEEEFIFPDGFKAWYETRFEPVPEGILILSVDITERKKAAKALHESEKKYRELADSLPEPIFETDMQGMLTYANGKILTSFGIGPDDLRRGVNVFDHVAPENGSIARERFARILRQEDLGVREYLLQRKGGGMFPAMVHTARITREGEVVGIRGVVVDITERKKLEEELNGYRQRLETIVAERTSQFARTNEKLLQEIEERRKAEKGMLLRATILDNVGQPIFLINPRGDFVYANEAALRIYGYSNDEFLNMNLRQLLQLQDLPELETCLKKAFAGELLEVKSVHLRKDRSLMTMQVRHSLIKTPHGEFIVCIARNIGE